MQLQTQIEQRVTAQNVNKIQHFALIGASYIEIPTSSYDCTLRVRPPVV